jgi:cell division transport system ATP-binding protein
MEYSGQDTIIDMRNVCVYHGQNLVLTEVSFGIERGEFVYLIGKVGSGKSSLIKTINAELRLQRGEGWVAGYKLHRIKDKYIPYMRRKIGVVFQDFQLLSDRNVYDNFKFVLEATGHKDRSDIKRRINSTLEKVDLVHKSFKMPHQLSGGEQQRVVIARALLNDPDIILADEPTGNLDPETSVDILKILHEINDNGKTILMATHNYTLLRQFPHRTLKCERGHLAETYATVIEIDLSQVE